MSQHPNPYGPRTYGNASRPMPPGSVKNWMIESILCLVLCGNMLAIIAIVYAAQVDTKLAQGDYQGAVSAANTAKIWCIVCAVMGLLSVGGCMLIVIMAAVAGA